MSVAIPTPIHFFSDAYRTDEGLAVSWGSLMVFHIVVLALTLVKTIQIKRRSGRDHTLTHVLLRDGMNASLDLYHQCHSTHHPGIVYFGYTLFLITKEISMLKKCPPESSTLHCCATSSLSWYVFLCCSWNVATESDDQVWTRESSPDRSFSDSHLAVRN